MTDLVASFIATHHPNWALLNILLSADKSRLTINKASEEAQHLHQENPNGTPNPAGALPLTEPKWDLNGGKLALLEHSEYILGRA